jgi:hypothetical protein
MILPIKLIAAMLCLGVCVLASGIARAAELNALILEQIRQMPVGGNYSAAHVATMRLQTATHFEQGKFFLQPSAASPSYCSGATYLVFLKTLETLRETGRLKLDEQTLSTMVVSGQRDGEGVWGRWNANGPGTARLFYELQLGKNFTDFNRAQPGDFMKIFWTDEVGMTEHGHSVVFLGMEKKEGVEYVRFWSSNIPAGYGEKSVPRSKISLAIFSRLETPENLLRIQQIPRLDTYLASLETRRSSFGEARAKCGF